MKTPASKATEKPAETAEKKEVVRHITYKMDPASKLWRLRETGEWFELEKRSDSRIVFIPTKSPLEK